MNALECQNLWGRMNSGPVSIPFSWKSIAKVADMPQHVLQVGHGLERRVRQGGREGIVVLLESSECRQILQG